MLTVTRCNPPEELREVYTVFVKKNLTQETKSNALHSTFVSLSVPPHNNFQLQPMHNLLNSRRTIKEHQAGREVLHRFPLSGMHPSEGLTCSNGANIRRRGLLIRVFLWSRQ